MGRHRVIWAESPLSYEGSGSSGGCNWAGSDPWGRRGLAGEPSSLCAGAWPPPSPSGGAAQRSLCRRARQGSSSPEGSEVLRLHRNVLETVLGWLEGWELNKHGGFSARVSRPLGETAWLTSCVVSLSLSFFICTMGHHGVATLRLFGRINCNRGCGCSAPSLALGKGSFNDWDEAACHAHPGIW